MSERRDLQVMGLLTGVFLLLAGAVLLGGVHPDVLLAGPLLVIAVPLILGRYVGEEQLHRLRGALAAPAPRRRATAPATPRRAPLRVVRAGLMLARTHASRPPPALPLIA